MTVSGYIPARDSGYRPEARLTKRQELVMKALICCRSNLANYTSTLCGMIPEKQRVMYNSYPFMPGWAKELGRLAERISKVSDSVG